MAAVGATELVVVAYREAEIGIVLVHLDAAVAVFVQIPEERRLKIYLMLFLVAKVVGDVHAGLQCQHVAVFFLHQLTLA